jgi:hypothetical protein
VVRRILQLAVLAALVLATPAPAEAAVTLKKAIWGPLDYGGVPQMPVYADLGAGIFQMTLHWNEAAAARPAAPKDPADPAYVWPAVIDRAIAEGEAQGIEVSLMVLGAPGWANGGKEWRWAPKKPADYADFISAAARRYPKVRHWMIWGEPSKEQNFQPLRADNGKPLRTAKQLEGPRLYARILDAAYGALKAVSRRNLVIGGNTYTIGTVAPLRWLTAVRMPGGRPPRMDMWGHNPFTLRRPALSKPPLGNGYADMSDLDTFVKAMDRAMKRARVAKQRHMPVFISEMTLPTDHENVEFNFYLDRPTQADWLGRALKISSGWDRIYTFGYLGLYDDPKQQDGRQVERGLITREGVKKPAYAVFKNG